MKDNTYKEISFGADSQEEEDTISVELEEVTKDPVEDLSVILEGEEEGDGSEEKVAVVTPKPKPKPKNKPSRSQKRIKDLLQKNDTTENENQALKEQLAELQKEAMSSSKQSSESMKQTVESQIESLNAQAVIAMEAGDSALAVKIQSDIMKAYQQQAKLDNHIEAIEATPEPVAPQREKPEPTVSEKALDWVAEYPLFRTDVVFHGAAMAANNQLMREGFDPNNDDFYAELNARLSPRFPEVFDIEGEFSVDYTEEHQDSSDEETVTPSSKSTTVSKKKTTTPPVAGASRASSVGSKSTKSKNKVRLSVEDQNIAESWGIKDRKMAIRKEHIRNNTDDLGYSPIIIG